MEQLVSVIVTLCWSIQQERGCVPLWECTNCCLYFLMKSKKTTPEKCELLNCTLGRYYLCWFHMVDTQPGLVRAVGRIN